VGKTSVAQELRDSLASLGYGVCVVDDGVRLFAPVLSKLFGAWYRAPRELIEYMLLGWQVASFVKCLDSDVVIMDYGPEAPLGYMDADGVPYPRELENLALALFKGLRLLVAILEPPTTYRRDDVRWEDLELANRYRRYLSIRALTLVSKARAKAVIIPERSSVAERARMLLRVVLNELVEGAKGVD